jgi:hypothetical protein
LRGQRREWPLLVWGYWKYFPAFLGVGEGSLFVCGPLLGPLFESGIILST